MFSVIFEVLPKPERFDGYLALAKRLRPILETIDGFIDNERFESRRRPGWILSHSAWRDEKSVVRWRTVAEHHAVQEQGRAEILADYHLRVGDVIADTDTTVHPQRFDTTEIADVTVATLTELTPAAGSDPSAASDPESVLGFEPGSPGVVDYDAFASIYTPGKLALLVSWTDTDAATRWHPTAAPNHSVVRHRAVRIIRDYGMFDRREAPQFYPDAAGRTSLHPRPAA